MNVNNPSDQSLQKAAQCWCDEETKNTVMDSNLAIAFAKRLDEKDKLISAGLEREEGMLVAIANLQSKNEIDSILERVVEESFIEGSRSPISNTLLHEIQNFII